MKISLIIPAFNEEKILASSLRSMAAASEGFTALGWEVEMIVCDNNSTDATAALAAAAGARVVFEPVNQIARARNAGGAAATGDWLVFVDADSFPSPPLFVEAAAHILSGRCLAGGCTVRLDGHHPWFAAGTALWNLLSRIRRWPAGSFIFCEAEAFRRLGGFSPELFASEEIDLGKRLHRMARAQGKRLVILHRHPLLTSARKARLYSLWEWVRFLVKLLLRPRKTVSSRDACSPWYDGRR